MSGKYHLPAGTSADGRYDLLVTPESAGWGYSGLRVLTLAPGETHALSTGGALFEGVAACGRGPAPPPRSTKDNPRPAG
ncbi:hypothetical protein ACFV23_34985, partial [Streptomyces sp. NPDC059627]